MKNTSIFFPPEKKLIRINATSEYFSINEVVTEDKSEGRLKKIRELFLKEHRTRKLPGCSLKVTTTVVNPTMF